MIAEHASVERLWAYRRGVIHGIIGGMANLVVVETPRPSLPLTVTSHLLARSAHPYGLDKELLAGHANQHWYRRQEATATPHVRRDFEPTWQRLNGLAVLTMEPRWFEPETDVVYFYGGGFTQPLDESHWWLLEALGHALAARIHLVKHPLAPEYTADVTVPAVTGAYQELAAQIREHWAKTTTHSTPTPARLVLAGDASGGGLALVVAEAVRGTDAAPDHLVLLSPWLDMTVSHPEFDEFGVHDPYISRASASADAADYRGGWELDDPRLSPAFSEATGLPPVTVVTGTNEALFPEIRDWAEKAAARGNDVALFVAQGGFHLFPTAVKLPESEQAMVFVADRVRGEAAHWHDEDAAERWAGEVWAEAGYDPAYHADADAAEMGDLADDSGDGIGGAAGDHDEDGLLWHGGASHWHDGPLDV